ncbi:MAG: TetR/AcrR family transcriptional regulator [Acidimicrobiales bacterium]
MGHKHTKSDILRAALDAALDEGLSQLTFGRLAKRLGISDRVIVYYFPTKADLVGEVIVAMGLELQASLADAFTTPAADHIEMTRTAWPLLASPDNDGVFALFFEANGLAAVGREPYASLVPGLVDAWIDWAASLIAGTPAQQRAQAEAAIATIEGLLLLRLLAGPTSANRAATTLGIV